MRDFRHINVDTPQKAVEVLNKLKGAELIAGGTDLLGILKDEVHPNYPQILVNIKTIKDLDGIQETSEGLRIGALTKLDKVETHPLVKENYPVLSKAAHAVASPQIRKMGTIGGNICQEPRCWYYRTPENYFHCTRKGGNLCNALIGENRFHSIFGAMRVGDTPCTEGCPAHVEIPTYMEMVREGKLYEASKLLLEANPIPAITGRVCPHFCEQECNRGNFDEAVSVRNVERYLGDYILDHKENFIQPPKTESGRRIAVLGSGPAGLSAAYYLRQMGHQVTVFEKMEKAGGMLTYAIPPYRLPKKVVQRVVRSLEEIGIHFRLNVEIGKEILLNDVKKQYDGVFLGTGAWGFPSIGLKGEEMTIPGLKFLIDVNSGVHANSGEKVLVIGGGNVAMDVALTAKRIGAKEVTIACLENREEMPAFETEIEQALEEGINLMPSWGPNKVLEQDGKVIGMELVRCRSVFDKNGAFSPIYDNASTSIIETDQIYLAIGQRTDLQYLEGSKVQTNHGLISINEDTNETTLAGVYAGGDAVFGPSSVVEALAAGREAAFAINCDLVKDCRKPDKENENVKLLSFDSEGIRESRRTPIHVVSVEDRTFDSEDVIGYTASEVERETRRCFNCGCVAVSSSDLAPALLALDVQIKTTRNIYSAEDFFTVGKMKSTVLAQDELVTEILIPNSAAGSKQCFLKFRLRNSIDFPILAVAVCIRLDVAGKVSEARIAIGAAAPIPLRVKAAEAYLLGKEINADTAETASILAISNTCSLSKNEYKIHIAKALVRRAILTAG